MIYVLWNKINVSLSVFALAKNYISIKLLRIYYFVFPILSYSSFIHAPAVPFSFSESPYRKLNSALRLGLLCIRLCSRCTTSTWTRIWAVSLGWDARARSQFLSCVRKYSARDVGMFSPRETCSFMAEEAPRI